MTKDNRAFEMTIDIDASPLDVWQALTDPRELTRWFPLEARVNPGVGGSVLWSWGETWNWETQIDAWDPPHRLQLVDEQYRPYDTEGRQLPASQVGPTRIAIEFTLQTDAGKTRLRLVHSGFGRGSAWEDEIDGITLGWQFELRSLRHYLRRHKGRDRHAGWARIATAERPEAAWARLVGPNGFTLSGASLEAGNPFKVETGDHRFTGTIELYNSERQFFGTVRELDDGVFRLSTYRANGKTGVDVWLSSYTPDPRIDAFQARAGEVLHRLFSTN